MALTSGQLEILRRKQMKIIVIEDYSICHHCKTKGLREEDNIVRTAVFRKGERRKRCRRF